MEAKLKEYRALRRRQQLINDAKDKLKESKDKVINFITPKFVRKMSREKEDEVLLLENEEPTPVHKHLLQEPVIKPVPVEDPSDVISEVSEMESNIEENTETWQYFIIKWSIYSLIWLTLFLIFVKLQFGAVFFIISMLIGICVNTHTRPKKKGEVSAYSVFNENCVSIDGTLKAEQFEREIRYGAGSVR